MPTTVAIPIALYRPQIGPPARNGKKMAEKWILAPPGKKGKNGRKMGKWPFFDPFLANFPIFRPFFPFFPGGAKIHFSAIFSHFGPEARFGVCTGQSGSQHYRSRWHPWKRRPCFFCFVFFFLCVCVCVFFFVQQMSVWAPLY